MSDVFYLIAPAGFYPRHTDKTFFVQMTFGRIGIGSMATN